MINILFFSLKSVYIIRSQIAVRELKKVSSLFVRGWAATELPTKVSCGSGLRIII